MLFLYAGSRQVTAAMAFLLALFSHILNHVVIRLQGALYDKENLSKLAVAGAGKFTLSFGYISSFSWQNCCMIKTLNELLLCRTDTCMDAYLTS